MDKFLQDLLEQIKSYYHGLIEIVPKIGLAAIAFLIAWFIASKVKLIIGRRLQRRMHDTLLANFLSRLAKATLLVIGILLVLRIIGLNGIAASLVAGAGISAFVIGFALKDIGENFLAGILLAFKRPFDIGDLIESNGVKGNVVTLNLRDTQVLAGGQNIYLPNALLIKSPLINYSREGFLSQQMVINVEFGADYRKAVAIIDDVARKTDGVLGEEKKPVVRVTGLTSNAVQITADYWICTTGVPGDIIRADMIMRALDALHAEGFKIPANVIDLREVPDGK